jgi:diguanylate cyclase (GGDEF)-like protein
MINIGLVVLDKDLKVQYWNRWMVLHSGIDSDKIIGSSLFDFSPQLDNPKFLRSSKSVFKLGNFCFFPQKLYNYLFPFKMVTSLDSNFDFMQQSCTMGPLRDEKNSVESIFISVQDVSEVVAYEHKLMEMNVTDGLTKAYNRRFLDSQLKKELERYRRYSRPFSLIMFDLDFFKKVNDTYGHQCGDTVLKSISSDVKSSIRDIDFLARYGGEEFCCLLPDTNLKSALILAERLRKNISNLEISCQDVSIKVTISLGVVEVLKGIDRPDMLLKKADEALYKAKKGGRNKVVSMTCVKPLKS